jgi:hypothetical protein
MHVFSDMGEYIDLAELKSPSLLQSSAECQVIFYYWLVGNNTGTLELYASTNTTALWKRSSAPANRWNRAVVSVGANPVGWRLFFELEPNLDIPGAWTDDVAIDDISFSKCSVNRTAHILDCDFEMIFAHGKQLIWQILVGLVGQERHSRPKLVHQVIIQQVQDIISILKLVYHKKLAIEPGWLV